MKAFLYLELTEMDDVYLEIVFVGKNTPPYSVIRGLHGSFIESYAGVSDIDKITNLKISVESAIEEDDEAVYFEIELP